MRRTVRDWPRHIRIQALSRGLTYDSELSSELHESWPVYDDDQFVKRVVDEATAKRIVTAGDNSDLETYALEIQTLYDFFGSFRIGDSVKSLVMDRTYGKSGVVISSNRNGDTIPVQLDEDGTLAYYYEDELELTVTPKNPEPKELSERESLLIEASSLVMRDRNNTYGEPSQDFQRSAGALNSFGYRKLSPTGEVVELEPHDVAIWADTVKTSRLMWSPGLRDSWADKAGYAACGYECAVVEGHVTDD